MIRPARRALVALALLAIVPWIVPAQDTTGVQRHTLPLDLTRLRSQTRLYDMVVHTRDSTVLIGQRDVTLSQGTYGGNPAWLLVESRTGIVPAAETLWVTPELRPLLWFSVVGDARLGATFVGDTIFGAVSSPAGKRTLVLGSRPDLLVSPALIETVMPLLPLTAAWVDSAGVLAVDMGGGVVVPAELSVIGEEDVNVDATTRQCWVVAVRADSRTLIFWVDKETGDVQRVQQPLPAHVGSMLEYRRRTAVAPPGQ